MLAPKLDLTCLSDNELVDLARNGDRDAFGTLITRHYHHCESLAAFILRDRTGAQDEVQKACWKAFEHMDQYQGTAEFPTWLMRIVLNECLMVLRVKRRVQLQYLDNEGSGPLELPARAHDPEYDLVNRELAELVKQEMGRMPPMLRNVVVLRDIEGLSMTDVAERLNITVAAAKSRLLRARTEVRDRLARYHGIKVFRMPVSSVRTMPARSVRVNANTY